LPKWSWIISRKFPFLELQKMDPYEHYTIILWCTIIIVDTEFIQNVNSSISHKNSVFMSFCLYGNLRKFLRGCVIFLLLDSLILLQSWLTFIWKTFVIVLFYRVVQRKF
jgi:hypothetical protein